MKIKIVPVFICLVLFMVKLIPSFAQLTGVKNIPGDYATITSAVAALNAAGTGTGGVTFNVAANYTENITATISLTATGTAAKPVVFQKNPLTPGANPLITAYTGGVATPASSVQDGIWRLSGSDYITINGIDIRDNPANTSNPSTMEYGYALYKGSSSNGCQYVTIQNCTVTLSNINNASATNPMTEGCAGILVMNAGALTATVVYGSNAGGSNSNNKFYHNTIQNCNYGITMIGATAVSPFTTADNNNDIGGSSAATGNTIINYGGAPGATNPSAAIRTIWQYGLNISYNTINNNTGSGTNHPTVLHGIFMSSATSASSTITNNSITLNGGGTTTSMLGIENAAGSTAAGNTINISNNSIINCTYTTATTASFYGIYNTASPSTLTVRNNTLAGNSSASASGIYAAVTNLGAVATAINIDSNNIGNSTTGAFTFTGANSGSQVLINNSGGGSAAALSISNNNFQGLTYAVQGSSANTYISNGAATSSQAINRNTFTNLNINTTGNITFISNSVIVPSNGSQNVNNNSIVGSFTKAASAGTVTLFTSTAISALGSVSNNNNNNFSNISITGTTNMAGWVNTDTGYSAKIIQNNTFSNWVAGTGAINAMNVNHTSTNAAVTGNIINNISGVGNVTGITTAFGNDNIYANTINTLSTTGPLTVTGILVTSGTNKNIFGNKIYDLVLNNAGGAVSGISVTGTTVATANIYNNLIGDLKAPIASTTSDVVRGISVITTALNSTINVYYNTIYLNAGSSGTNFSSSGIYHTANATASTAMLNLRNNSITNLSVPNGSGIAVAYRRSGTALNNYASASNNNLFYAGAPGTNRLLFYDGASSDQTLALYKTRVSVRDAQSVTEDLVAGAKFLSTAGSSLLYLHMDPAKASQVESGAVNITSIATDKDADIRQASTGYAGTGTAPDIGADEFGGTKLPGFSGTYSVGAGQTFTSLTNAGGLFAGINSLGLAGNVVVNITSDLVEDGSNTLFQWAEQGTGSYTLTIQPNSSTVRTISGNVLSGMIRLNGAKRVTFDGSNGTAGNYLTFRNTNTTGTTGTAFTFINGASFNTIKYCTVEAYSNATNGVILFSSSNAAGGNSNNLVSSCNINATVSGNTGTLGIYSAGTAGNENSSNTISGNNIFNYRDRGVDIPATGSKNWTISSNSFYNGDVAGAINYAASSVLYGIRILGGSGYSVLNNYIGGNASQAAGSNAVYASSLGNLAFYSISLTAGTGTSDIKGNVIRAITVSSVPAAANAVSFVGIETIGAGIINVGGIAAADGNMIGSNTANGTIIINTNTTSAANTSFVRGIYYTGTNTASVVINNQAGGIDINNQGSSAALAAPSTFQGVMIHTATAPSQVNNNIVGSNGTGAASNSIRVLAGSMANVTTFYGVFLSTSVASTVQVNANIVRNISHQVSTVTSGPFYGIYIGAVAGANITVSNCSIKNNSVAPTTAAFYGIYNNASPSSLVISGDTISGNTSTAGTTGLMYGVYTQGASATVAINNNTFSGNTVGPLTSAPGFVGFYNNNAAGALSISGNAYYSNVTNSSGTGSVYFIRNTAAVTGSININSNTFGTASLNAITFNANSTSNQFFIDNINGTGAASLSVSNNQFRGINYAAGATGGNTYINNIAATLSQAINGNSFINLNVNTSGNLTFIASSVVVPSTGSQNVNNNAIAGTFTKTAGNNVTLFTSTATSASGAVINNNNNNFSNITVTGATSILGWINTDAGSTVKTIQNNTFTDWTGGTSSVTTLQVNAFGTSNAVSGNLINTISSAGAITGISTGAGNDNIYSNTINTLSSTGAAAVTAIAITAGTTKNIYKNKIYDVSNSHASGTVNGIVVSGGTTVNLYNNLIGNLRTPAGNAGDPVRGISVTSTTVSSAVNVYYNTVFLNASSTGSTFGTSGIYHIANATATTATLNLRNNSITNISTAGTTGYTVAYRLSTNTLGNYDPASNNNLLYAGAPGPKRLLFWDGTTGDSTLAAYKSRVSSRDAASITEDISAKFLSTSGSSAVFLHLNSAIPTAVESGAANITGFTDDFDGQIRAGNTGYTGSSSFPDIGADEVFGAESIPPVITYTLLSNATSAANRSVTGITITDASGINVFPGTRPRIYYKRNADANVWLDNSSVTNGWKYTEATNSSSPFTFTIDYSLLYGGAAATAGIIQYFIVAQDIATTANTAVNSGTFSLAPSSVALTSAAFPVSGTINSYNISFSGTYNVGSTEVFTSLTKADGLFASVNSVGLRGNLTVNITSDLAEDGSNALNQWTESGVGNYTMSIQPDAATIRTVSGNAVNGLIRLNGADRVTIDGRNGGSGTYLSFKNTSAAGTTGTAFTFINAATNNAIRYCDVQAYANAVNGVILFSTSSIAGGNSNNIIDNCILNATVGANTGNSVIYSAGTAGNENSSNTISNNSIYDYRDRGLDITAAGSTAWTISGNSFYNGSVTGTINYVASSALHGIRVLGGSGYAILNNYIGGNAALASGTNAAYSSTSGSLSYQGILLTTSSASPVSNIKGNTIASISLASVPTAVNSIAFTGIETNGSGINIGGTLAGEGNIIGSATINGSVAITTITSSSTNTSLVTGINCSSTNGLIIGNQVAGIDISNMGTAPAGSAFRGIYVNSATAPSQVNNNIIGSIAISDNIRVLPASIATSTSLTGISIGSSVNSVMQVNGNAVENISQLSTTSSGTFTGINNAAASGAGITISNDTIQHIITAANANSGSSFYTGIFSGAASVISNNIITTFSLAATGVNAQVIGISVSGASVHSITGNMISSLTTASSKAIASVETGSPATSAVTGILNAANLAGQIISSNTLYDFNAAGTSNANTMVTGIGITSTVSGSIFNNRIAGFTNMSTGSGPGIGGIVAANGSFNLYNNSINLDNAAFDNGVKMYGIIHAAGQNWNYYHNTVKIGGVSTGTAFRSAAFIRPVNGSLLLRNNVFVNTRTGTGLNYALSNVVSPANSTWPSTASNYNDLYSSNTNTTGEWGTSVNKTFVQWQAASGGEANAVSRPVIFITSVYDLQPETNGNCGLNNSGTPITTPVVVNTDINAAARSGVSPDMGAYEFNYTSFIASAGNNSPVCSNVVSFTADPGTALQSTYSWTNPGNIIVATTQNPDIASVAGVYTVAVTDGSGCVDTATTVITSAGRSTGLLSGPSLICSGSLATISIAVTGSGTVSGALNSGDIFSGTAPLITVSVYPAVSTSYFITNLTDGNCPSQATDYPDTLKIKVSQNGEWTGASGTSWNDDANWCGGIPTSATDVLIPSGMANYPIITSPTGIHNIVIATGASLVNTSALQIGGTVSNAGTFNVSGSTIEMNGTSPQTIPANTFAGNSLYNLIISNNVTLAGPHNILHTLSFGSSNNTLYTNDSLILKSALSGTARLADITNAGANSGNSISGKITIERYISSGKAWRLLSAPLSASGAPSMNAAWQEGVTSGNPSPGYGTQITGGTAANGFDLGLTNNPSVMVYNNSNDTWVGLPFVPGTNAAITDYKGYLLFIRGNRSINLQQGANAPNSVTTLRMTGQVNTGTIAVGVNAHNSTLVGNPYPSAIDFHSVTKNNVSDKLYIWDPKIAGTFGLGAYVTLLWNGSGYDATSSVSPVSRYIPSGEAFFVESGDGINGGTLTFKETDKTTNGSDLSFRPVSGNEKLRIDLLAVGADGTTSLSDGVLVTYGDNNSNETDRNDAKKVYNWAENICIASGTNNLAIERRHTIDGNDTTFLNVYNLKKQSYKLKITTEAMENSGLYAVLKDNYSATINNTPLNMGGVTEIVITVTSNLASSAKNRFSIVFAKQGVLPVTFVSVKASRQQKDIKVEWQTAGEINIQNYQVEVSADGSNFSKAVTMHALNNSSLTTAYHWLDANAAEGLHYYRIKSTDFSGAGRYSPVVQVMMDKNATAINVAPNPVTGGVINLHFGTAQPGQYNCRLLNPAGQLILKKSFVHQYGTTVEKMPLAMDIAPGIYNLEITNPDNDVSVISLIIRQ